MMERQHESDGALARVGDDMARARSLDEVVAVLRRTARAVAGSDGIAVVLREDETCFYAAEDAIEPLWLGSRFPLAACISGWAMLHDETVILPDIECDPRIPLAAYVRTAMRSLVMVPVGSPVPVAALGAYWCAAVFPDAETVRRIEALARHAADAIERLTAASGRGRAARGAFAPGRHPPSGPAAGWIPGAPPPSAGNPGGRTAAARRPPE